ncbi:hypothetical protein IF2G_08644 [Cordyceps javanica]|nr:hypothetical protein IF2G_08644 [Cordyceps javanica]
MQGCHGAGRIPDGARCRAKERCHSLLTDRLVVRSGTQPHLISSHPLQVYCGLVRAMSKFEP